MILIFVAPAVVAQCPYDPIPRINPYPPQDVCLPDDKVAGIKYFDYFSWQSFVALVWPTSPRVERGVPLTDTTIWDERFGVYTDTQVPVFQSYKTDWETFQDKGAEPSPWNDYESEYAPCRGKTAEPIPRGSLQLAAFSKFGNVRLATLGDFAGPLISQNKQYTRFLAAFNEAAFDNIRNEKWYLQSELTDVKFKPQGMRNPITVKSSWVVMTDGMDASRFYTTWAYVLDTETDKCTHEKVGLVGLHIVTKTPSRPQWIWSTFEQVDNVPLDPGNNTPQPRGKMPYTYNNGKANELMPSENPIDTPTTVPCVPPPKGAPCPFNVTRITPIAPSTRETNKKYQDKLAGEGSGVWQYYELVMTQWPTPGNSTKSGQPANTIPGNKTDPMTAFANTTMETFDQAQIDTGCMACHDAAGTKLEGTDFNWALPLNAFPAPKPKVSAAYPHGNLAAEPTSPALKKLIAILAQGQKEMAASPKTAKPPAKKKTQPKAKK